MDGSYGVQMSKRQPACEVAKRDQGPAFPRGVITGKALVSSEPQLFHL